MNNLLSAVNRIIYEAHEAVRGGGGRLLMAWDDIIGAGLLGGLLLYTFYLGQLEGEQISNKASGKLNNNCADKQDDSPKEKLRQGIFCFLCGATYQYIFRMFWFYVRVEATIFL